MNLKYYGICFKMRGGPDLLDYVQRGQAVPVEIMEQVMNQMGTITHEEMAFAEKLDNDWKRAFNEKVTLTMGMLPDGGYDITCTAPNELINTVNVLYGLDNGKIIEEYTAFYLKDVCGIDADIISVDVEHTAEVTTAPVMPEKTSGFDLSDLNAVPEQPAFEDVSQIESISEKETAQVSIPEETESVKTEPEPELTEEAAAGFNMGDLYEDEPEPGEEAAFDDQHYEEDEAPAGEDDEVSYENEDVSYDEPQEDEISYDDEMVQEEDMEPEDDTSQEEDMEPEQEKSGDENRTMENAMAGIYTELVENIKDRKLDERLGLRIGGQ